MESPKTMGRVLGFLVLTHLVVGLMVPFIMLDRVKRVAGLVAAAAASPSQVRAAVLLLFLGSAVALAMAIAVFPIFRRHSRTVALWLLAVAIIGFSLQAVDNAAILSALSLSQEYARADASKLELFQGLALAVNAARKWTHYCSLLFMVTWILLFCAALFRFRLVPRWLAGLTLAASALQIYGVTLRGLLGYPPETRLAMPLAPAYVALAIWLIAKGFDERHRQVEQPAAALVGA